MNYLYHLVPKDMAGEVLYPMNVLKEKYPELYAGYTEKYIGREELMELRIPTLGCLWNDVLHLSAIHPRAIKEALIKAGSKKEFKMESYQIGPHLLNPDNTTVYFYKEFPAKDMGSEENLASFKPDEIEKYSSLPEETKEYYKEKYSKGEKPLLFHMAVHILYKGSINIKDLPVVEG